MVKFNKIYFFFVTKTQFSTFWRVKEQRSNTIGKKLVKKEQQKERCSYLD